MSDKLLKQFLGAAQEAGVTHLGDQADRLAEQIKDAALNIELDGGVAFSAAVDALAALAKQQASPDAQAGSVAPEGDLMTRHFSDRTMKDHDDLIRAQASREAWADLLERFHPAQRRDIANMLAHSWSFSAVEIQSAHCKKDAPGKRYESVASAQDVYRKGLSKKDRAQVSAERWAELVAAGNVRLPRTL